MREGVCGEGGRAREGGKRERGAGKEERDKRQLAERGEAGKG